MHWKCCHTRRLSWQARCASYMPYWTSQNYTVCIDPTDRAFLRIFAQSPVSKWPESVSKLVLALSASPAYFYVLGWSPVFRYYLQLFHKCWPVQEVSWKVRGLIFRTHTVSIGEMTIANLAGSILRKDTGIIRACRRVDHCLGPYGMPV